jgi:hypothetical protein
MRLHCLAPGAARVRLHPEIRSSVATLLAATGANLVVPLLLATANFNLVVALLLATRLIAALAATRDAALAAAMATIAGALGHGLRWAEGDQGKQDRK